MQFLETEGFNHVLWSAICAWEQFEPAFDRLGTGWDRGDFFSRLNELHPEAVHELLTLRRSPFIPRKGRGEGREYRSICLVIAAILDEEPDDLFPDELYPDASADGAARMEQAALADAAERWREWFGHRASAAEEFEEREFQRCFLELWEELTGAERTMRASFCLRCLLTHEDPKRFELTPETVAEFADDLLVRVVRNKSGRTSTPSWRLPPLHERQRMNSEDAVRRARQEELAAYVQGLITAWREDPEAG